MRKTGNYLYWFLTSLLFIVICLRTYRIPITFDESGQIIYYAQLPFKDILLFTNPWPTNHIFNSLLIKWVTAFFAINQITGRIPNVIFSLLTFYFVYKLARKLAPTSLIFPLFCLSIFILDPFLFDFFGLARGYGLAIGFELGAFYFLLSYFQRYRISDLLALGLFLFLMVLSNFSWLVVFVSIVGVTAVVILRKQMYMHFSFALVMLAICFLVFYTPVVRMNETNQFVYWSSNGFYKDTVVSLWNEYKYGAKLSLLTTDVWIIILYLPLIFSLFLTLYNVYKSKTSILDLPILLLVLSIIVNLAQNAFLGTPFLTTRTALLYVPLYAFSIAAIVVRLRNPFPLLFFGTCLLLFLTISIHFLSSLNFRSVREWSFDQNTFDVLAVLQRTHLNEQTPIDLNTMWLYHPSLLFYKETEHLDWLTLYNAEEVKETPHKTRFFYIDTCLIRKPVFKDYREIKRFENRRVLLEHIKL